MHPTQNKLFCFALADSLSALLFGWGWLSSMNGSNQSIAFACFCTTLGFMILMLWSCSPEFRTKRLRRLGTMCVFLGMVVFVVGQYMHGHLDYGAFVWLGFTAFAFAHFYLALVRL
jgi:zinc transporter ZupT